METVKYIRKQLDFSQNALAKIIGVSQSSVSNYERLKQEISPSVARRLVDFARSRGLKVSLDDIYAKEPLP